MQHSMSMIQCALLPTVGKYLNTACIILECKFNSAHVADVIIDNFAEEELRTVRDGLPCTQGVNVLLPVFNLR